MDPPGIKPGTGLGGSKRAHLGPKTWGSLRFSQERENTFGRKNPFSKLKFSVVKRLGKNGLKFTAQPLKGFSKGVSKGVF